jgi:hypothetical protein
LKLDPYIILPTFVFFLQQSRPDRSDPRVVLKIAGVISEEVDQAGEEAANGQITAEANNVKCIGSSQFSHRFGVLRDPTLSEEIDVVEEPGRELRVISMP